jgi:hypothetical protein
MDKLRIEIARLRDAVLEYNRALPYAVGLFRERLIFHRVWDLETLAGYQRQLAQAAGYAAGYKE